MGILPTPVTTDAIYLDNVYFSNGNDVAAPMFEIPTSIDLGFTPDEMDGFSVQAVNGAEATVATSPNGDEALRVVKADGADAYGSSVSMSYPAALGLVSLVSDQQTDVVMNVYAPAAGETIRMRLQSSTDPDSVYIETDVVTTQTGWQTLRFELRRSYRYLARPGQCGLLRCRYGAPQFRKPWVRPDILLR